MKSRRWIIKVFVSLVVILGGVALARKIFHASLLCSVKSQFAQVPPDDSQLTQWIQSQPGVVGHTVIVTRIGSDRKTVRVNFIMDQNLAGEPPDPDLDAACERFGYSSPVYKFRWTDPTISTTNAP
jgi:hypothetical protein